MCGRFSITKEEKLIEERFGATFYTDELVKRYNAAPSQNLPVISQEEPDKIHFFRWGLIPFWAKDSKIGFKMINARAEGILESKVYRKPLEKRRCLIPADGFYEWRKVGKQKLPIRFTRKDDGLFAFAGIYETWKDPKNGNVHSFSIITCPPNELVKPVHDRMPVILDEKEEINWLDNHLKPEDAMSMLKPFPTEQMRAYEVSTLVNSAANNMPEIIEAINSN